MITHKYGYAPSGQVCSNESDLVKQIFRLLPEREESNPLLDRSFTSILFRISGLNKLLQEPPELITVLSLLEAARTEQDFALYRKAILDSCNIMNVLIKRGEDSC